MRILQGLTSKLGILVIGMLAGSALSGAAVYAANTVGSIDIIDNSIQSVDIKDGEVKTPDIGANAVTSPKIATGGVTATDLASNAVTSTKIAGSAVTLPKLAANSVDGSKIVDRSIGPLDIGFNSVGSLQILDGEVNSAEIAADAVGGSEIAGVSSLIFGSCQVSSTTPVSPGGVASFACFVNGVTGSHFIIATLNSYNSGLCFDLSNTKYSSPGVVTVYLRNNCSSSDTPSQLRWVSIIAFITGAG